MHNTVYKMKNQQYDKNEMVQNTDHRTVKIIGSCILMSARGFTQEEGLNSSEKCLSYRNFSKIKKLFSLI